VDYNGIARIGAHGTVIARKDLTTEVGDMQRGKIVTPHIDSRSYTSEELLMLAVLEQAFTDLRSSCPAVHADAEAYFLAYRPESSTFSLDAVCSHFKLSPAAIRDEARRRLKNKGRRLQRAA